MTKIKYLKLDTYKETRLFSLWFEKMKAQEPQPSPCAL